MSLPELVLVVDRITYLARRYKDKYGVHKIPRGVNYDIAPTTVWCCDRMKDLLGDELGSSGTIAFDRQTGDIVLRFHWGEREFQMHYCPFCGAEIRIESGRKTTYRRVRERIKDWRWTFKEVK